MDPGDLRQLLDQVRAGQLTIEAALERLRAAPVADLGYAQVDLHRRDRCGFPEVIFCEGKSGEWVEGVVRQLAIAGQDCLATRVSSDLADHLEALARVGCNMSPSLRLALTGPQMRVPA